MPIDDSTTREWRTCFAYSEWLDQQGLLVPGETGDERSHENLVDEFMAWRDEQKAQEMAKDPT